MYREFQHASLAAMFFAVAAVIVLANEPGKVQVSDKSAAGSESTTSTDKSGEKPFWTLNLKEMKIPDAPVSGMIHGEPVILDSVNYNNWRLTLLFREKNGARPFVRIQLPPDGFDVPKGKVYRIGLDSRHNFQFSMGDGNAAPSSFGRNCAMILQFGDERKEKGKKESVPVKVYLCLTDEDKSFIAGTLTIGDPNPDAREQSEISGKIMYLGPEQSMHLGCHCEGVNNLWDIASSGASVDVSLPVQPGGGVGVGGGNGPRTTRQFKSELLADGTVGIAYKHLNHRPGSYLISITGLPVEFGDDDDEVVYDWKWVELKGEKAKVVADLTIDPKRMGTLEVNLKGSGENSTYNGISITPYDSVGRIPLPESKGNFESSSVGFYARFRQGNRAVQHLPAGKYRIAFQRATTDVTVEAGKTTKASLKAR